MDPFARLSYADLLREERARVAEANDCHDERGQFCVKYGRQTRAGRKKRAQSVLRRVEQAHQTLTTPGRRRSLYRRERVAQKALDYINATGFWGTLTGRAHEHKRAARRARWQKAAA